VGQASCLSSFAVAVVEVFSEAFTTADRLEACPTIQSHFNFRVRVESSSPLLRSLLPSIEVIHSCEDFRQRPGGRA